MLDLADEFGLNEKAETNGVWIPLGEDAAIKIARLGNPDASKAYRRIPRAMRNQIEGGILANDAAENFVVSFLADNVVKDWRNLVDGKTTIVFSRESAVAMMKKHSRFRERIWELASDDDNFNVEEVEDAKNSQKPSVGS